MYVNQHRKAPPLTEILGKPRIIPPIPSICGFLMLASRERVYLTDPKSLKTLH